MRLVVLAIVASIGAGGASAKDTTETFTPLPSFGECMDGEAARFERALRRLCEMPEDQEFEIGDTRGTGYCGSVGFVLCDRKGALDKVEACQLALAAEQDMLAERIRATLPAPEDVTGRGGDFEQALYPRVHAMAMGLSAGPDCDGDIPQRRTWCIAWEANNRLRDAVLAWQLARYLDAVETAVVAGWAEVPPPKRPQARDGHEDD
ncbi:hypothetical protein [Sagittula salina]|uniref:DUF1311 domain-containing protein n=1 Tax=Sagittula salina TaxID=2820268 RepID=A0A940MM91_9RHOB|nr:hypothetical protein [Sagittula salina]MBP0481929.1 hypothetical protein [Sagittula salina]